MNYHCHSNLGKSKDNATVMQYIKDHIVVCNSETVPSNHLTL